MMMKMNKKRKKSSMSMDKGMKLVKSTKKGMAGDDMLSMDTVPMMKKNGGAINQHKKMAMGVKKAMGGIMTPNMAAASGAPAGGAPNRMPGKPPPQMPPRTPQTMPPPTSMPPTSMPPKPSFGNPPQPGSPKPNFGFKSGGMVQSRGNGAARGKKTKIC